jgi:hypothetical protein
MTSIIVLLIYPAIVYGGITGAAGTIVFGNFIALFMQIFWCRRVIPIKFDEYIKCYIPGLLMAFPVVISINILLMFGVDSLLHIIIAGLIVLFAVYALLLVSKIFPALFSAGKDIDKLKKNSHLCRSK